MSEALYTTQILRLAASIPHQRRLENPQAVAVRTGRVCGSRVEVGLDVGSDGRVNRVGIVVSACALGQASASLLGAGIVGARPSEIATARDELAAFLSMASDDPGQWPGLQAIAPARPYKARHPAIMLSFEAAAEAAAQAAGLIEAGQPAGVHTPGNPDPCARSAGASSTSGRPG